VENASPVIQVLLAERHIEPVGVACSLDVAGGRAFSQHQLHGIAGNEMNEQEDGGDD